MESDHQIAFSFLFVTFLGFSLSLSHAYTFYVGGKNGWVLKPTEDYNHWAGRNRFLINDTLIFRYKKGHDTVLEVDNDDYNNCYKEKPLQALKDGVSEFKFNRSGPFFFISGHADNCAKGQKLIIVVLHPRSSTNKAPSPVVANSPSPLATNSPIVTPSPSPVVANNSPSPAAKIISPNLAPTPPSPVILHHLAPAPAPSSATVFGGSIGSLLGLIFFVTVAFGYLF